MVNKKFNLNILPFALWGVIVIGVGVIMAVALVFCWTVANWMGLVINLESVYSIVFWIILIGHILISLDLFFLMSSRREGYELRSDKITKIRATVILTAYNDEQSIAESVKDFKDKSYVSHVIVIDNNSKDGTNLQAIEAGARVFTEMRQGYGACVYRGLREAARVLDSNVVVLCEGDRTFRADDLDKMFAYLPHADIVNGTRIVEQLREHKTQLTNFMYFGNFFAAKILELKHLGKGTFTDLGTTYKVIRTSVLREIIYKINFEINLEYNAYFLDTMLKENYKIVEVPITFHERVGLSKGGNKSNLSAISVGARMLIGILSSWKFISKGTLTTYED